MQRLLLVPRVSLTHTHTHTQTHRHTHAHIFIHTLQFCTTNDLCYAKLLHWTLVFRRRLSRWVCRPDVASCRCGRERACVCTSEGLLRDVAPVGGVLAQRERSIATPPHHCNAAGLQLNAPTTTYRISSSPAQTHTHTHTETRCQGALQILSSPLGS